MKSHKSAKKRRSLPRILIIVIPLIIIFLLTLFILEKTGIISFGSQNSTNLNTGTDSSSQPGVNYNTPTNEQVKAGEDIKNQNNQEYTNDLGVSISSATVDNDIIKIRSIISGIISSSGTCNLKMTNGSAEYKASASTFAMTSYSTCQGFDINKSELGSGDWQIILGVTAESKTSTTTSSIKLD